MTDDRSDEPRMARCDVLDILEAAILTRCEVIVARDDGATVIDRPTAIAARDGEDHVSFAAGDVVAVGTILGVRSA